MRRGTRIIAALTAALLSASAFGFAAGCGDGNSDGANVQLVKCNKKLYYDGEEIYISAEGDGDAWVGVYRDGDDVKKVEPVYRYNVAKNGFISGATYALKKAATNSSSRQALRNLPRGKYKVVLFEDSSTNKTKSTSSFTVKTEKIKAAIAPTSIEYKLENATDGMADGTLTLNLSNDNCTEEVVLYWADDDGVLDGYTSLAPFFVTDSKMTFDMYANTIIPQEATRLVAYGKNSLGLSEEFCAVELPDDCQYDIGQAECEFSVVSDVHITIANEHIADPSLTVADQSSIHDAHFTGMLEDIKNVSPTSGGVFIVGDIANAGYETEWQHAQALIEAASAPDVFFTLGNHDLYGGAYSVKSAAFKKYAKTDSVYYEKVVGGYHHIALGSESSGGGLYADLSDSQLEWFEGRLKDLTESEPNKPVFVYLHQSLYNTIAGSFPGQNWDGVVQDEKLRAIVKKYPQVCMFNGHSHWDLNTRGSMHDRSDGLPNIFNTASVGYLGRAITSRRASIWKARRATT